MKKEGFFFLRTPVWEPDEANLLFNSVGSLCVSTRQRSLSDLNKQLSKEEASSEPENMRDGSPAKFRGRVTVSTSTHAVEGFQKKGFLKKKTLKEEKKSQHTVFDCFPIH